MAQTDRQTDISKKSFGNWPPISKEKSDTYKETKAIYWMVTGFHDDISLLEDVNSYPNNLWKVYGGVEKCPTSGREHFQGVLRFRQQVRWRAIRRWLPMSFFEPVKFEHEAVQYALKESTAVGEKKVLTSEAKYYTTEQFVLRLAEEYCNFVDQPGGREEVIRLTNEVSEYKKDPSMFNFWTRRIILGEPTFVRYCSNVHRAAWTNYSTTFINLHRKLNGEGGSNITPPETTDPIEDIEEIE